MGAPGAQTCQALGASVGAACDAASVAAAPCDFFERGLYCARATLACQSAMFAAGGGACNVVGTSYVACAASGRCSVQSGLTAGACAAAAADGAPCDTAAGPECMAPARCVAGGDGGTAVACRLPAEASCP